MFTLFTYAFSIKHTNIFMVVRHQDAFLRWLNLSEFWQLKWPRGCLFQNKWRLTAWQHELLFFIGGSPAKVKCIIVTRSLIKKVAADADFNERVVTQQLPPEMQFRRTWKNNYLSWPWTSRTTSVFFLFVQARFLWFVLIVIYTYHRKYPMLNFVLP